MAMSSLSGAALMKPYSKHLPDSFIAIFQEHIMAIEMIEISEAAKKAFSPRSRIMIAISKASCMCCRTSRATAISALPFNSLR